MTPVTPSRHTKASATAEASRGGGSAILNCLLSILAYADLRLGFYKWGKKLVLARW